MATFDEHVLTPSAYGPSLHSYIYKRMVLLALGNGMFMDASDSSSPDKAVGALSDVLGYMGTVMLIVTRAAGIKACM
eukprot:scaffold197226_cov24-Tisochrysis_lutea.AAC.1